MTLHVPRTCSSCGIRGWRGTEALASFSYEAERGATEKAMRRASVLRIEYTSTNKSMDYIAHFHQSCMSRR